jgi:ABC-2 type transport system ATP-binding protein
VAALHRGGGVVKNYQLSAAVVATSVAMAVASFVTGHGAVQAATCPAADAPVTVAATATTPGYTLTRGCIDSFDATPIVYDLYEPLDASPSHPVYSLLEEPGWGGGGPYSSSCPVATWQVKDDPPTYLAADFAFLTWDPRGFGESGGVAEVDDPNAEGRDVSQLIDHVLSGRPEIAVDEDPTSATFGQPAVGMTGGSYGGGIQLAATPYDARIKAIVPQWAWNDLDYSLFPNGVLKQYWFEFLMAEGIGISAESHYATQESCDHIAGVQATPVYDQNLYRAWAQVTATGYADAQTLAWFHQRSLASYGSGPAARLPEVPTLLLQGVPDTLFNLNEAWANYQAIAAANPDLPVKLIGYCGGHAGCQYPSASPSGYAAKIPAAQFVINQTINWFDVYLRHKPGATDDLPDVLLQDQTGRWHPLPAVPTASRPQPATFTDTPVSGSLVSADVPTDANNPFTLEQYPASSNSSAPNVLTIPLLTAPAHGNGILVAGEPHLDLNVTVQGSAANLFVKLIDQARNGVCSPEPCWSGATGVVDGQTSALRVDNLDLANGAADPALPPSSQHVSLDLGGVVYTLPPGDTLELQITTTTSQSAADRGAAVTTFDGTISLPTLSATSS